jgi:hypothetical protein
MQTPSKLEKIIILIEKIRDLGLIINTERSLNTKSEEYKIAVQQKEMLKEDLKDFISTISAEIPLTVLHHILFAFYLDVYFILRSYHTPLTFAYFGDEHMMGITEYFVNIIKTHSVKFMVRQQPVLGQINTPIYIDKVIDVEPKSITKSKSKSITKSKRRHSNPSFRSRPKSIRAKSI